mgnify:FL=1
MKMKYEIRKGNDRILMTMNEIMKKTGLQASAVRHRLKQSNEYKIVLAKKGKHIIGGYTKADKARAKRLAKARELNFQTEENKAERKKKQIKYAKHPFWDKGEEGKLHRLLWGAW